VVTPDRLRQLADGYKISVKDDERRQCWECNALYGPGIDDLRRILGPDAARLLADAINLIRCRHAVLLAQAGEPYPCGDCPECLLLARFAALGEEEA
jgi:hypothetical protein